MGFTLVNSEGSTEYFYVKNLQGDILKVIDAAGTVHAAYTYDAWGNILSSSGTMASINPLRYRGYYYDAETGLYYLQSRYYDPEVGRFINADSYASTGQGIIGCNMFAYCLNNPVIFADFTGYLGELVIFPLLAALTPIVYTAAVTITAVAAVVAVAYLVYTAADYVNDVVSQAKKSSAKSSGNVRVDTGGGTASPPPPPDNKHDAKEFIKSPKNARQVLSYLKDQGFKIVSQNGSHVKLVNDSRTVIVPNHGGKDIAMGTQNQ